MALKAVLNPRSTYIYRQPEPPPDSRRFGTSNMLISRNGSELYFHKQIGRSMFSVLLPSITGKITFVCMNEGMLVSYMFFCNLST